jgi:hypothetical protein
MGIFISINLNLWHLQIWGKYLGVVHIIRNSLGGGSQRFVTKIFKNIGICTVLRYEGGKKTWEAALRII